MSQVENRRTLGGKSIKQKLVLRKESKTDKSLKTDREKERRKQYQDKEWSKGCHCRHQAAKGDGGVLQIIH